MTTARVTARGEETREHLLDAAERLLLAEGYAAVTSRRVGAEAGLNPALVHYHFGAMDDLFLAVYRRRVDDGLDHLREVLEDPQPLWALWEYNSDPRGTAFTMEFVALANHRPAIRAEIATAASRVRAVQVEALDRVLRGYGIARKECPPLVASVLLSSISRYLVLEEQALGITDGHADTLKFVEGFLRVYEGPRRSR
ncbi:MAG: TetR/AcrR family transcriptional regulator [Acidimicrobiia bacterium]